MSTDSERDRAFKKARRTIERLMGAADLDRAYSLARLLVVNHGQRAQSWYLLALICTMQDKEQEASTTRDTAALCTDHTPYTDGDMRRDVLLGWLDWRKPDQRFWLLLAGIRKLCEGGDEDRSSYLAMVEGRIRYAEGDFIGASSALWLAHSNLQNSQWRYGTLLPYLKALIMGGTTSRIFLNELFIMIVDGAAEYGSPRDIQRARHCIRGKSACKRDDLWQRITGRLGWN